MSPAEVPDALVEKARKVLMKHGPSQGTEPHPLDSDDPRTAEWVEGWHEAWLAVPEVIAAVLSEIQAQALRDFADGLPSDWKRPNGPADAARAHAEHLLECTCAEAARRTTTEGSDV